MSKHSKGPWEINRVPIQSRGGSNTCYKIGPMACCIYDDWRPRVNEISEAENEANAHLIAAAPELLEACKAAEGFVTDHIISHNSAAIIELVKLIRAAITKAEGKP